MRLTIESADNGFVLRYADLDERGGGEKFTVVETDEPASDARNNRKLLWAVMEHFNMFGSKHDDERIYVVLKNQEMIEIE